MRISIMSGDRYIYTENIARTVQANSTTKTQSASKDNSSNVDADFEKTLKEIQTQLQKGLNSSVNSVGTTAATAMAATSSVAAPALTNGGEIDVTTTDPDYVSIAPNNLKDIFKRAAEAYGMDQKLLELIGYHESRFQTDATSKHGAMGVMQLMPGTASDQGVQDAYDPEQNIMGATKLLKYLSNAYNGDLDKILSAYSAGMDAVSKYGGIPPYEETVNYVAWIRERYP